MSERGPLLFALTAGLAIAAVGVVGLTNDVSATDPDVSAASTEGTTIQDASTPGWPLDDYPGFGRTDAASLRDDTIAYWEAFQRELEVTDCMTTAGFDYSTDVLYPSQDVLDIAAGLGITPRVSEHEEEDILAADPGSRNREVVDNLEGDALDDYTLTLWGRTAAEMDAADGGGTEGEAAQAPDGEDQLFGGCRGTSDDAPGVWDTKLSMNEELVELRLEAMDSEQFAPTLATFAACATEAATVPIESIADLQRQFGEDPAGFGPKYHAVNEACLAIYTEASLGADVVAADELLTRHQDTFDQIASTYRGILDEVRADEAFLEYLQTHADRADLLMKKSGLSVEDPENQPEGD